MKTPDTISDEERIAVEQERAEQAAAVRDAARQREEETEKYRTDADERDAQNLAVEQERQEQARAIADSEDDEDARVRTNADYDEAEVRKAEQAAEESRSEEKKAAKKSTAKKSTAKNKES